MINLHGTRGPGESDMAMTIHPRGGLDPVSPARRKYHPWNLALIAFSLVIVPVLVFASATASQLRELPAKQKMELEENFRVTLQKRKGPFGKNVCVCSDRRVEPVLRPDGTIQNACGEEEKTLFCSAFRAPWAEALGQQGMYVGNLFSTDLYRWGSFPDHHDLVRGHILEKYFIETHPNHKLAVARALRGVSGAEYEAAALPGFVEEYLSEVTFKDSRHFLLAYELQKRFFVNDDQGQVAKVRNIATQIEAMDPKFKPLRDATHNQISASLIPRLTAYRDRLGAGKTRARSDALIAEIDKLTSLDERALEPQLEQIANEALRTQLKSLMPAEDADPLGAIESLSGIMVRSRKEVAQRSVSSEDARRLIDLNVTAATVIQSRGSAYLESGELQTVKQHIRLLMALIDASYGVGLLTERERKAAKDDVRTVLEAPEIGQRELTIRLERVGRIAGWAHEGALLAFAEVWDPWTLLLSEVRLIGDDILRGSPLLLFGQVIARLDEHALGQERLRHEIFGKEFNANVRALNPGLAKGTLRVNPQGGTYSRDEVLALAQTPAELQPAAGILTQGEGNVLSHVQLLARALGIPNVVTGGEPFARMAPHSGKDVFFVVTPRGRVYLKEVAEMTAQDQAIYSEFNRNTERVSDGTLGSDSGKLRIDHARLDLSVKTPLDLTQMRLGDSGVRCGPKAAYLGELKNLFPENVSRGVVLPFGVYYEHYQRATVAVPAALKDVGIAEDGDLLPGFVESVYQRFFGEMVPAGTSERELTAWITPRLEIIRSSIIEKPLSADLKKALEQALDQQGLLRSDDRSQTVGCFVRSDTNVEDLENFNGAGLNLTLFNLRSLREIHEGIKKVWGSPFTLRSFSWRQPLIDEPLWVLPSVVILESVPSEKSGVLVTADIFHGDQDKMLVTTSEGVGGAVDGSPAETVLWSPQGMDLVNSYKSAWRLVLKPGGGSEVVPSTGEEYVLQPTELEELIAAAIKIRENLAPVLDPSGKPRPWDIEFGFAKGRLWLFQARPFLGNEEVRNTPALALLDGPGAETRRVISLDEVIE